MEWQRLSEIGQWSRPAMLGAGGYVQSEDAGADTDIREALLSRLYADTGSPEATEEAGLVSRALDVGLSGLGFIGSLFDKFTGSRPLRGLLAGRPRELLSILPFSDTLGITDESEVASGRDVLQNLGLQRRGDDSFLGGVAGFATDLVLDPSAWFSFGAGALTRSGLQKALAGGKAAQSLKSGIEAGDMALATMRVPWFARWAAKPFVSDDTYKGLLEARLALGTGEGAAKIAGGIDTLYGSLGKIPYLGDFAKKGLAAWRHLFDASYGTTYNPVIQKHTKELEDLPVGPALDLRRKVVESLVELEPHYQAMAEVGVPRGLAERELWRTIVSQMEGTPTPRSLLPDDIRWLEPVVSAKTAATNIGWQYRPLVQTLLNDLQEAGVPVKEWKSIFGLDFAPRRLADVAEGGVHTSGYASLRSRKKHFDILGGTVGLEDLFTTHPLSGALRKPGVSPDDAVEMSRSLTEELIQKARPYFRPRQDAVIQSITDLRRALGESGEAARPSRKVADLVSELSRTPSGQAALAEIRNATGLSQISDEVVAQVADAITNVGVNKYRPNARKLAADILHAPPELKAQGAPFFSPDVHTSLFNYARALGVDMKRNVLAAQRTLADPSVVVTGSELAARAEEGSAKLSQYFSIDYALKKLGLTGTVERVEQVTLPNGAVKEVTRKVRPAAENVARMLGVSVGDLNELYVPRSVVRDLKQQISGIPAQLDSSVNPVIRGYDAALSQLKQWLTSPWPANMGRNVMTSAINMARADVMPLGESARQAMRLVGGMDVPQHVKNAAVELMIRDMAFMPSASHVGDALTGYQRLKAPFMEYGDTGSLFGKMASSLLAKVASAPSRLLSGAKTAMQTGWRENLANLAGWFDANKNPFVQFGKRFDQAHTDASRLAVFLDSLKRGMSYDAAAKMVASSLGDFRPYTLTRSEQWIRRLVMPFYTWSKANINALFSNNPLLDRAPTRDLFKFVNWSRSRDTYAPEWVSSGVAIPVAGAPEGSQRFISALGLPTEDDALRVFGHLAQIPSGSPYYHVRKAAQAAGGMLNPLAKLGIEWMTNTQLFSGRPLSDLRPSTTVSSVFGFLPKSGQMALTQLAANSPAARVLSTVDKMADERKDFLTKLVNLTTGVRMTDVDMDRALQIAMRDKMTDLMRESDVAREYTGFYVPRDRIHELSPRESAMLEALKAMERWRIAAAKQRQRESVKPLVQVR